MSGPKWSPAPWRIGKNPHDVFAADDRGVVIDVDMDIPDDVAAANARLIAAAPELAAFAEKVRATIAPAVLGEEGDNYLNEDGWDAITALVDEAITLLARARGETL